MPQTTCTSCYRPKLATGQKDLSSQARGLLATSQKHRTTARKDLSSQARWTPPYRPEIPLATCSKHFSLQARSTFATDQKNLSHRQDGLLATGWKYLSYRQVSLATAGSTSHHRSEGPPIAGQMDFSLQAGSTSHYRTKREREREREGGVEDRQTPSPLTSICRSTLSPRRALAVVQNRRRRTERQKNAARENATVKSGGRTGRYVGERDSTQEERDGTRGERDGTWENGTAHGRTGRHAGERDGMREKRDSSDAENGTVRGRCDEVDSKQHARPRMSRKHTDVHPVPFSHTNKDTTASGFSPHSSQSADLRLPPVSPLVVHHLCPTASSRSRHDLSPDTLSSQVSCPGAHPGHFHHTLRTGTRQSEEKTFNKSGARVWKGPRGASREKIVTCLYIICTTSASCVCVRRIVSCRLGDILIILQLAQGFMLVRLFIPTFMESITPVPHTPHSSTIIPDVVWRHIIQGLERLRS
ncbi:hypothetical protein WMY93_028448 [Mugilogobius chulae]|uniref:Uncharacterized protein n=1 Tax=Mugilogobius chulae TaxID=88201 RepID=A0AAW0MX64_9GOBI